MSLRSYRWRLALSLTLLFDEVVPLELFVLLLLLLLFLPQPAARKTNGMARAVIATPRTTRFFMRLLSFPFRRRSPFLSLDRRNAMFPDLRLHVYSVAKLGSRRSIQPH